VAFSVKPFTATIGFAFPGWLSQMWGEVFGIGVGLTETAADSFSTSLRSLYQIDLNAGSVAFLDDA
jgi:hypothetical protein